LESEFLVKIAASIPINCPLSFTNAPPDMPGLTAASVCTKSSMGLNPTPDIRVAETTPQVMEISRPKLFPIAQALVAIRGW